MNSTERIVALVDMDCFYVQVEQRLCPEYLGKPCVVVQYNQWKGGGIIAVNYEARAFGIERRGMRGDDAKKKCADVHLFSVPVERGKANLTRYREAGAQVMEVMCQFSSCVERASIDEAYLDLTEEVNKRLKEDSTVLLTSEELPNTFVVGWEKQQRLEETVSGPETDERDCGLKDWLKSSCSVNENDRRLAVAAVIVEEMRAAVLDKTTFKCSAGIAHNKMLAKLACGLHKPNRQTILPHHSVPLLYETLPVNKVRSLGGKLGGEIMETFSIKTMGELSKIKENILKKQFGEKNGTYLFQLGQGIEFEPVNPRQLAKSIGCGKNIRGNTKTCIQHWVNELSEELSERLFKDQKNNSRVAKHLTISFRTYSGTQSRSCALPSYDKGKIANDVMNVLHKVNTASTNNDDWHPILTNIALSASKFHDHIDLPANHIKTFFAKSLPAQNPEPTNKRCKLNSEIDISNTDSETAKPSCSTETPTNLRTDLVSTPKGFFARKMEDKVSNCNIVEDKVIVHNTPNLTNLEATKPENEMPIKVTNIAKDKLLMGVCTSIEDVNSPISTNNDHDEFTYLCEKCNKKIPLQDIEEHTDFHYAQKLAKELQSIMPSTSTNVPCPTKPKVASSQKKRGRTRKSEPEKKSKVTMKPLEFYLK